MGEALYARTVRAGSADVDAAADTDPPEISTAASGGGLASQFVKTLKRVVIRRTSPC
jgi:hypothetical protein